MTAQPFGDKHTVSKLETVQNYLKAYTTALKNQSFELIYVDACAGSGSSVPKSAFRDLEDNSQHPLLEGFGSAVADTDEIIVGSAIRALGVDPPFHRYLFNDVKRANVDALRTSVEEKFAHLKDRITITRMDANDMLIRLCSTCNWRTTRAVVFIDPFGLQINYETLLMLGRTKAVDVWYLVPVFAMYRQISGQGQINEDGGPRVDAVLGTKSWRDGAVTEEEVSTDLFNQAQFRSKRAVNFSWFEKIAKERIGSAFGGQILDEVLPLGRNGIQEFSLMFAWANPSEKAKLAAKLARAVLK